MTTLTFTDFAGYRRWLDAWKAEYKTLTRDLRAAKARRRHDETLLCGPKQGRGIVLERERAKRRVEIDGLRTRARDMMAERAAARARAEKIAAAHRSVASQPFPLAFETCKEIVFHFNKMALDFPFMPPWVVKAKGRSFYVRHVDAMCPWSTKETPDASTKGAIRFRNCRLEIDADGAARIKN